MFSVVVLCMLFGSAPERGIAPDLHDREKEEEEEEERKQTTEQQQLEAVSDGLFYHQQQELEVGVRLYLCFFVS